MIHLSCKNRKIDAVIELTRSKSESNRALVLNALLDNAIRINHLSDSDDTCLLSHALKHYQTEEEIDVGHAGTSFRFLTAFLAIQSKGTWLLTGSERMKQRPIKILVDALRSLGAQIAYLENEGYPPLKIQGNTTFSNEVVIDAGVSSQYISALMLIGCKLRGGLKIFLKGEITSLPYLMMTFSMIEEIGIGVSIDLKKQVISIKEIDAVSEVTIDIEGDWSAASYWYSVVALGEIGSVIRLEGLNEKSRQGDAEIKTYFEALGVKSIYCDGVWKLEKKNEAKVKELELDLSGTPDVTQTLVCTCAGLGIGCNFVGLHTLRIKETDRLEALKVELMKFGVKVNIVSDDQLIMSSNQELKLSNLPVATYKDHRMAMAFAPLSFRKDLSIENEMVVSKSYPNFWKDFKKVANVKS